MGSQVCGIDLQAGSVALVIIGNRLRQKGDFLKMLRHAIFSGLAPEKGAKQANQPLEQGSFRFLMCCSYE